LPSNQKQPSNFPWYGKVIPWSAALRNQASLQGRILADLPRGENVKVILRATGWLYVEAHLENRKPLKGYVSQELIRYVQPTNTAGSGIQQKVKGNVTPSSIGSRPPPKPTPHPNPSYLFRLAQPKIIAIATDTYLKPKTYVNEPGLPDNHPLGFGQDLDFGAGRALPRGHPSVGSTTADLKKTMRFLLHEFASGDGSGKAKRLFDDFLKPQTGLIFWSDSDLTAAAEVHPNITTFIHRALSAPNSPERSPGKTRIHQALKEAGWDINAVAPVEGLGVPAFNDGSPFWHSGDFNNGLGVMINGIQHVIVVAKDYYLDRSKGKNEYYIKLEYVFYDVFGLDDEDVVEYGADGGWVDSVASKGITAWWQLQHQHNYPLLITRIAFEKEFWVPIS